MSVSPMSQGDNSKEAQRTDQIHFKFCRECSNLLYPKEDRSSNTLVFACRTCHVDEPATSYCVFQNKLNSQVGETAGVTQDVGSDPTVGLPLCLLCGQEVYCDLCNGLATSLFAHDPNPTAYQGDGLDAEALEISAT